MKDTIRSIIIDGEFMKQPKQRKFKISVSFVLITLCLVVLAGLILCNI